MNKSVGIEKNNRRIVKVNICGAFVRQYFNLQSKVRLSAPYKILEKLGVRVEHPTSLSCRCGTSQLRSTTQSRIRSRQRHPSYLRVRTHGHGQPEERL